MSIALEETLFKVIKDGQAQRSHFHTILEKFNALVL
jgi:hypothetical protein